MSFKDINKRREHDRRRAYYQKRKKQVKKHCQSEKDDSPLLKFTLKWWRCL